MTDKHMPFLSTEMGGEERWGDRHITEASVSYIHSILILKRITTIFIEINIHKLLKALNLGKWV